MLFVNKFAPVFLLLDAFVACVFPCPEGMLTHAAWLVCTVLMRLTSVFHVDFLDVAVDIVFFVTLCTALCCAIVPILAGEGWPQGTFSFTVRPALAGFCLCPAMISNYKVGLCAATFVLLLLLMTVPCDELREGDMTACFCSVLVVLLCCSHRVYVGWKLTKAEQRQEDLQTHPSEVRSRAAGSPWPMRSYPLRVFMLDGTLLLTVAADDLPSMCMSDLFQRLRRLPACQTSHGLKLFCGDEVWHAPFFARTDTRVVDCLFDAHVVAPWTIMCATATDSDDSVSVSGVVIGAPAPRSEDFA